MTEFNQALVAKHFDLIKDAFDCWDSHPEYFYIEFYSEYLHDTDIISDSVKEKWMKEWKKEYEDDDIYDFTQSFDELLEENEELSEEVAIHAIRGSDSIKQMAAPKLFEHIMEFWEEDEINQLVEEVNK